MARMAEICDCCCTPCVIRRHEVLFCTKYSRKENVSSTSFLLLDVSTDGSRCAEVCRHILGKHDEDDIEALFSLAQALEALGRSTEGRECANRASSLLSSAS